GHDVQVAGGGAAYLDVVHILQIPVSADAAGVDVVGGIVAANVHNGLVIVDLIELDAAIVPDAPIVSLDIKALILDGTLIVVADAPDKLDLIQLGHIPVVELVDEVSV